MKRFLHKVRLRLLFSVLSFALSGVMVKAENGVILKLKDGTSVGFAFSAQPKIVMGRELTITDPTGSSVSYDYAKVQNYAWGDVEMTAIGDAKSDKSCDVVFRHATGIVTVSGLSVGSVVSVHNLSGFLVSKMQSDGTELCVPLPGKGLYVVSTSTGASYKVMNP